MKRLLLLLIVVLSACDDSGKKAYIEKKPRSGADGVLDSMEKFKDQACACKDLTCAEKADRDLMEWAMKHMDDLKDIKPTEEQEARADALSGEMQACKRKLGGM